MAAVQVAGVDGPSGALPADTFVAVGPPAYPDVDSKFKESSWRLRVALSVLFPDKPVLGAMNENLAAGSPTRCSTTRPRRSSIRILARRSTIRP